MAKKIKSRLGADGYNYPYTHEDLIFNDEGVSLSQRYVTQEQLNTVLNNITLKRITKAEYDALTTKDPNTLYIVIQ